MLQLVNVFSYDVSVHVSPEFYNRIQNEMKQKIY